MFLLFHIFVVVYLFALVVIENEIYVSTHYNPCLLPDYSSHLFCHHEAMLMQHDVRDLDLYLIPPWEYYDKLWASTMILCDIRLHMYVSNGNPQCAQCKHKPTKNEKGM